MLFAESSLLSLLSRASTTGQENTPRSYGVRPGILTNIRLALRNAQIVLLVQATDKFSKVKPPRFVVARGGRRFVVPAIKRPTEFQLAPGSDTKHLHTTTNQVVVEVRREDMAIIDDPLLSAL